VKGYVPRLTAHFQPLFLLKTLTISYANFLESTTIEGTKLSLDLATEISSIKGYIYISSGSVASGMPFSLLTESATKLIDAETHPDSYAAAKATADTMVLAANQLSRLHTAVLRPSGIIGERDSQVIPGLIKGMQQGMPRFQFGDGSNKFDFTYAGNIADATVNGAEALIKEYKSSSATAMDRRVSGEAFWITNGEPTEFWSIARLVWSLAGDRTPCEKVIIVPMWLIFLIAGVAEWIMWLLSAGKKRPQKFNRNQIQNFCLERTFDITKARQRLGYEPKVSLTEGIRRGVEWTLNQSG
jgi:sterol-4alpha-carboxylate 3-dehydrogenase (decarboxylating)